MQEGPNARPQKWLWNGEQLLVKSGLSASENTNSQRSVSGKPGVCYKFIANQHRLLGSENQQPSFLWESLAGHLNIHRGGWAQVSTVQGGLVFLTPLLRCQCCKNPPIIVTPETTFSEGLCNPIEDHWEGSWGRLKVESLDCTSCWGC